ncbi:MAG: hypothetical protein WC718_11735 [Phycisphaerales bacterium]|jgi:hypothetical protein
MSDPMHDQGMPPAGLTPPTDAQVLDEAEFGELVLWPKVIGIISIVWASLGLLCVLGSGVMVLALPSMMAKVPGYDPTNPPPSMVMGPLKMVLLAAGVPMAGLLLFAGISTVARKEVGRLAHLAYGGSALFMLAIQIYIGATDLMKMDAWIRDNPTNPIAKNGNAGGYIGLVITVTLGIIWPLFSLVWFGVVKNKPGAMKQLKASSTV